MLRVVNGVLEGEQATPGLPEQHEVVVVEA
jgi:hypothetical protein